MQKRLSIFKVVGLILNKFKQMKVKEQAICEMSGNQDNINKTNKQNLFLHKIAKVYKKIIAPIALGIYFSQFVRVFVVCTKALFIELWPYLGLTLEPRKKASQFGPHLLSFAIQECILFKSNFYSICVLKIVRLFK